MNNAGIGGGGGKPWQNHDRWRRLIEVDLWGVINGVQAFTEAMLATAWAGVTFTSCAPTTRSPARWTSAASSGPPTT